MAATTAAVIGGVAAVGGLISSRQGAKAAGRAASGQAAAAQAGVEESGRQFDITQASLQPRIEAGNLALTEQQALLGLSGADAQEAAFTQLQESPGQRFLRQRQQRALVRNAAAIGGLGGGNVRTALQEQAVGFGQQDIQNQFGRLGQLAGQGTSAAISVGQFGAQSTASQANLRATGADARASGILGAQQARAQGFEQFTRGVGQIVGQFNTPAAA